MADDCSTPPKPPSYCNLDRNNNVWVEGVLDPSQGLEGICLLDTMSEEEIIYVLQRNPQSRMDLPKVTSDPIMLELLATTEPLPEDDLENHNYNKEGLDILKAFRGLPPGFA